MFCTVVNFCYLKTDKGLISDFDLSDAQQEHALAVERLAPELAALRTELCLGYMTEGSFWKIYFVLVHPRLSRHDAVILSTPPVSLFYSVSQILMDALCSAVPSFVFQHVCPCALHFIFGMFIYCCTAKLLARRSL